VSARNLLANMLGYHLIPCLLASAVIYLVLWLIFTVARFRRPAGRVLFLYAGLLKAALVLWAGESVSCLASHPKAFGYFFFRLPNLLPDGPPFDPRQLPAGLASSELLGSVLLVILILLLALLCYRWSRIAPVYRGVYRSRRAEASEFPEVFEAFDRLVTHAYGRRSWLRRPTLMLIRDARCPAFTMGIRSPIIVLSVDLVDKLGSRELTGILAHELAHVRRLDYLGRWLATMLRDIMIWNPFVLHWYSQLEEEQEKASDEYAARLLDDPLAVASGLVEVGAYSRGLPVASVGPLAAWRTRKSLRGLNERVGRLAEGVLDPSGRHKRPAFLLYPLLILFLAVESHVAVSLPRLYAVLSGIQ